MSVSFVCLFMKEFCATLVSSVALFVFQKRGDGRRWRSYLLLLLKTIFSVFVNSLLFYYHTFVRYFVDMENIRLSTLEELQAIPPGTLLGYASVKF